MYLRENLPKLLIFPEELQLCLLELKAHVAPANIKPTNYDLKNCMIFCDRVNSTSPPLVMSTLSYEKVMNLTLGTELQVTNK